MIIPNPILSAGAVATLDRLLADQRSSVCIIQRKVNTVDGSGAPIGAWATEDAVSCRVVPSGRQATETTGGPRYGPITDYDVLLPRDTVVENEDRILANGRTLVVVADQDAVSHGLELLVTARVAES